jgi:hypothetical protein
MHDPFQIHSAPGLYSNPLGTPYTTMQFGQQGYPGTQGYGGINPLQQQLSPWQAFQGVQNPQLGFGQSWGQQGQQQQVSGQQNPLLAAALQNPLLALSLQNQLIAAALQQNPLAAAALQNPFVNPYNPYAAQQLNPIPAQQYGYAAPQFGSAIPQQYGQQPFGQFGSQLAPQSWIGQGQFGGQQPGQVHPLISQLAARSLYGPAIAPWGAF